MPFGYHALSPLLNFRPEMIPIGRIDASVHEAKAIRWTYDGIARNLENGPFVDFDEIQVATETVPRRP